MTNQIGSNQQTSRERGKLPRYEEIASQLITEIDNGTFAEGSKLPSEAELQTQFSVSRVTVRQALGVLEYQGWIRRFRRKGSFVTRNPSGSPTASMGGLKVIQFLHSGFQKSAAHPFSRGEVEAAEQYYSQKGIAVTWNAMDFCELLDNRMPPAVKTGACAGILLDGHLTSLHVELVRRWNKPFVVLGEHELDARDGKFSQVGADTLQTAKLVIEAINLLNVECLLVLDNGLSNFTHRKVLAELDSHLSASKLPPVSLLSLEVALESDFFKTVDGLGKRCGICVSSFELTGILMSVMQQDKDWKRHPFIALGSPFPGQGPHLDCAAWVAMSPNALVKAGCHLLDEIISDPKRTFERIKVASELNVPEGLLKAN